MSLTAVQKALAEVGRADAVRVFDGSSATVELAAGRLGVEPARIAKTVALYAPDDPGAALLVVMAGDARLNSGMFKRRFGAKPRMLRGDDVEPLTGHAPGGVCPFANPPATRVHLDESLRRFDVVHPAAGDAASAVVITPDDLAEVSGSLGWVDVAVGWRPDEG